MSLALTMQAATRGVQTKPRQRKTPEVIEALNCPLRCCRAPEFASGEVLEKLKARMILGYSMIHYTFLLFLII